MTQKHTPTPWQYAPGCGVICAIQHDTHITQMTPGYHGLEEAHANAEFIIRACNAYDGLVAALLKINHLDSGVHDLEYACNIAGEALAEARGRA